MKARVENISLRPTAAADLPDVMDLWNDGRVMGWVGFPDGLHQTAESMATWLERVQANPLRHHFVITGSVVGFCGEAYYSMDPEHRRASLDIKLRPEAQGGGRAAAAFRELIQRVFEAESDADVVWTEPAGNNLAARPLFWSCGLRPRERPDDLEPGPSYWELRREPGAT